MQTQTLLQLIKQYMVRIFTQLCKLLFFLRVIKRLTNNEEKKNPLQAAVHDDLLV